MHAFATRDILARLCLPRPLHTTPDLALLSPVLLTALAPTSLEAALATLDTRERLPRLARLRSTPERASLAPRDNGQPPVRLLALLALLDLIRPPVRTLLAIARRAALESTWPPRLLKRAPTAPLDLIRPPVRTLLAIARSAALESTWPPRLLKRAPTAPLDLGRPPVRMLLAIALLASPASTCCPLPTSLAPSVAWESTAPSRVALRRLTAPTALLANTTPTPQPLPPPTTLQTLALTWLARFTAQARTFLAAALAAPVFRALSCRLCRLPSIQDPAF